MPNRPQGDTWFGLWLLFAQAVTVLLAVWFVVATLKPQWMPRSVNRQLAAPAPVPQRLSGAQSLPASFRLAVEAASPSVVSINTARHASTTQAAPGWHRRLNDGEDEAEQSGMGSGVIVDAKGLILTNNHVVFGADELEVVLSDGRQIKGQVVGTDPDTDLALIRIELSGLHPIEWGALEDVQVGDPVLAIGNPFGVGQTATSGIVSALGRKELGINTFENFIQTDAAINPGNSGGALVDGQGRLLGINTAIFSGTGGNLGIGFAIPSTTARKVMDDLQRYGQVVRGWIGVEPRAITPDLAQALSIKVQPGVVVAGVVQNGPAHQGGIQPGDVLQHVQGQAVSTVGELLNLVAALTPGQSAEFQVRRADKTLKLKLTPVQRPKPGQSQRP